jgi:uncharacterized membrane protein YphA (DoxX/SURF4 family)
MYAPYGLQQWDKRFIALCDGAYPWVARLSIFVIYFWFGLLKFLGLSPAGELVKGLAQKVVPFLPFEQFYIFFACCEMLIGLLFLIPRASRLVVILLAFHLIAVFLPLILMRDITWASSFVPTLEGQYIIKNLLIVATAIGISARVSPWTRVRP